jgi:hypothetical protein
MVRDWMDGEVATGSAGRVGVAVAGMGEAVSVTAAAAEAGGKVAIVGMAGETVLQAATASRIASPPGSFLY